ncbi:oxygen-independent coproporphyrinogen III oxidase [Gilvimarinus xylanilyticus]|uniref:Coproporphyrinogen-III oxidase n=1 Tax=Gilvimarinus xylanilyticus TaxID=2944139 RepID=A0A9X2I343_9GAMM|nr:oxygen-independent coproporphyrinogen III oxidase [Gilvimarinus xylanilyticus]MCP8898052.1 oxygen-independent coproporphyrinogen III oxidase [Gilvimarinus xylanilyticus]
MTRDSISTAQLRDLVSRYDLSGPRYTSYPTAPHFAPDFAPAQWLNAQAQSRQSGRPLSLYFHLPFCQSLCYYCGCNKVVTHNRARVDQYLNSLEKELQIQAQLAGEQRRVTQIHWGGGTPTYLSHEHMRYLMALTREYFFVPRDGSAELAIEIHPGQTELETLKVLRQLGFNRLSMGVQDFAPEVQAAVNRYNTYEDVEALIAYARELRFGSLNMDLIYGLPRQTPASFAQTLKTVIALRPDRLSLFNYAHMPRQIKSQRLINESELPTAEQKLSIFNRAVQQLSDAGYRHIGMDHFALEGDSLVQAQRDGRLQRNFQGYSTGAECDLIGLGVSSISSVGNAYWQNHKSIKDYAVALATGQLPIERGITLSRDDEIRRWAINEILCHYRLNFAALEARFGLQVSHYFSAELEQLEMLQGDNLVQVGTEELAVTPLGKMVVRRIAMVFDRYLQGQALQYSKVI